MYIHIYIQGGTLLPRTIHIAICYDSCLQIATRMVQDESVHPVCVCNYAYPKRTHMWSDKCSRTVRPNSNNHYYMYSSDIRA